MDSITQAALGATIGHAFFRDRLGNRAALFGGLCGMVPDLDIFIAYYGEFASMQHHRGLTHSLFLIPVYATLLGFLGWLAFGRQGRKWPWIACAFWATWTHPLLDLCNQYGTPLLLPFVERRFALDTIAVLDPFYSLPLMLGLIVISLPWIRERSGIWIARGTLAFATLYLVLGFAAGQWAVARAETDLRARGFDPVEVRACPMLFTIGLRRISARNAAGEYRTGYLSVISPQPVEWRSARTEDHPLVQKALAHDRGRLFQWFAQGMVTGHLERTENGARVILQDQRYGFITADSGGPFRMTFEFAEDGTVERVRRIRGSRDRIDVKEELTAMWRLLWGLQSA